MDDLETSSERALARMVLDAGAREVLVGGLGLGYTARELLAVSSIRSLVVAEIRDVVRAQDTASLDAILLDVDNGPDFLVYNANASVYRPRFIAECARRLRPDGILSLWSMTDSAPLRESLAEHFEKVAARPLPVDLQGRAEHYWILEGIGPSV